ncbi:hypothetical protein GWI33_011934 [Rhynchophorus ferrugineus]|uniref:Uncharacterized protein n=1 Tax=Rhynchophorus ferrugineus TaxID=354439 RepID=A0A834IW99_RHYFE|nr:hypothetical protein GWI33_011934 [Rhynchophorus ferrugineus]
MSSVCTIASRYRPDTGRRYRRWTTNATPRPYIKNHGPSPLNPNKAVDGHVIRGRPVTASQCKIFRNVILSVKSKLPPLINALVDRSIPFEKIFTHINDWPKVFVLDDGIRAEWVI